MEVVALGAAYQAEHATSSSQAALLTIHSLAQNLGVNCGGHDSFGVYRTDLFSILLRAGTKIPAKHTETYHTVRDDQDAIEIGIYELDAARERVSGEPLEFRRISGLPGGPAGSYDVEITFEYSIDQRLEVTIAIPLNGIHKRWVLGHERRLQRDRGKSQERVARAFGESLGEFSALAQRARSALVHSVGAPRSQRALETLTRAINANDFSAASRARTDLLGALFDEGVTLG
jgi:molecular chaperone DnaK (HSP70)